MGLKSPTCLATLSGLAASRGKGAAARQLREGDHLRVHLRVGIQLTNARQLGQPSRHLAWELLMPTLNIIQLTQLIG